MFYKIENNSIVDASGFVEEVLKDDCMSFFQAKDACLFDKWIEKQDDWFENEIKLSQNALNIQELQWKNRNDVDYEAKLQALFQEKQELSKFIGKYNDKYFLIENGEIVEVIDAPVLKDGWYDYKDEECVKLISFIEKKESKLKELQENYYRALQVNVTNGVNFTVDMRSKDGTALLQIINDARNSFIDDNVAKQVQTFYVSEDLNGVKSQQEIQMLNWLWWYIFGELPDYHKACRQLYDNLTISIESCTTEYELDAISIEYPHKNGVDIHIPNAIKYIVTHTKDTFNNVDIIFPSYVKEAIDTSRREFFSKANTSYVLSKINGIIESSFFEKAKT